MKKYTLTTVDKLKPGDTFKKVDSDIIYTILPLKCSQASKRYVQKGELRMTDMTNIDEQIIYLGVDEGPMCSIFGCGKKLNSIEALAGNRCTAHMGIKRVHLNKVLKHGTKTK